MVVYWGISKNMFTQKIGGNATFFYFRIFFNHHLRVGFYCIFEQFDWKHPPGEKNIYGIHGGMFTYIYLYN